MREKEENTGGMTTLTTERLPEENLFADIRERKITKVMVSGLPGKMATLAAQHLVANSDLELLPFGLTGPEVERRQVVIGGISVELFTPSKRGLVVPKIRQEGGCFALDFTTPESGLGNAQFFTYNGIPFVMGTTGIDYNAVKKVLSNSQISAVVCPNFAVPIMILQAMFEWAAKTFPGALGDFRLSVTESHQSTKKDTSGTAKVIVGALQGLGIDFPVEDIVKVRDPALQLERGVPHEALGGHGFHNYCFDSSEGDVHIELTHNVVGRDVYARGALTALRFLAQKMQAGVKGKMYSAEDMFAVGA